MAKDLLHPDLVCQRPKCSRTKRPDPESKAENKPCNHADLL